MYCNSKTLKRLKIKNESFKKCMFFIEYTHMQKKKRLIIAFKHLAIV